MQLIPDARACLVADRFSNDKWLWMPPNKRRYPRTEVEIITDISVTHATQPIRDQGSFLVLGAGGGLVTAEVIYPVGCLLLFRFRLPEEPEEICCQGVVCDEIEGRGMGVEFVGIRSQDRERIKTFVAHHATDTPAS